MSVSILFAIEAAIAIAESSSGQKALRGLKNVPCFIAHGHVCAKRPVLPVTPTDPPVLIELPDGCYLVGPDLIACEAPAPEREDNTQTI